MVSKNISALISIAYLQFFYLESWVISYWHEGDFTSHVQTSNQLAVITWFRHSTLYRTSVFIWILGLTEKQYVDTARKLMRLKNILCNRAAVSVKCGNYKNVTNIHKWLLGSVRELSMSFIFDTRELEWMLMLKLGWGCPSKSLSNKCKCLKQNPTRTSRFSISVEWWPWLCF